MVASPLPLVVPPRRLSIMGPPNRAHRFKHRRSAPRSVYCRVPQKVRQCAPFTAPSPLLASSSVFQYPRDPRVWRVSVRVRTHKVLRKL